MASRSTRTSSPSSRDGAASGGLALRELAAQPVAELGVGAKLRERLALMGLETVLDVLQHYPRRYLDRTRRAEIAELRVGDEATVFGEVRRISSRRARNRRQTVVEAVVYDGTSLLSVVFFNQPWRERQLPEGTEAAFFGRVDRYRGRYQLTNPAVDILERLGEQTGVIVPVYPQSGKADVFTWQLRKVVDAALDRVDALGGLAEPLPTRVRHELHLADRTRAYPDIHRPETMERRRQAARRLKFDEFLRMQLGLVARKRALEREHSGIAHVVDAPLLRSFHAALPFRLTGDQRRAIDEITRDLARRAPMHRLLQGDVGSGKTVVALSALLVAVQGGYLGAFMAPTEVLAEQHFLTSARLLDGLTVAAAGRLTGERPVTVRLLTNRTGAAERRRLSAELETGEIDVLIGTHALIYGEVGLPRVGVVVIDEQHRFGVEQRALLSGRARPAAGVPGAGPPGCPSPPGRSPRHAAEAHRSGGEGPVPDVLVMTATPIPRTAGFLVYGDLDKSELREMPPGRTPIVTEVVGADPVARAAAYGRLRAEVAAGRQGYVVCPLVEGSPRVEAKAATDELERLGREELAGLRLGLLHGQMRPAEKEAVMGTYRGGGLDVLVATTVIEVGVDVPNATVMIVDGADRFGLSQLHQLRGRVGRGGDRSWCFLFAEPSTPEGEARMRAIAESTDGFLLAERDLEIRGAGEVFGERQSGFGDLKLGRIPADEKVVVWARRIAERILDDDPELARHRYLREEVEDLLGDDVEFLFKS